MMMAQWTRRVPLKFFLLATAGLYFAGEEYPFSPFPMYDDFAESASVVYVTDSDGQPVATQKVFGQRASDLKKTYETHLRQQRTEAAKETGRGVRLADLPAERVAAAAAATLDWLTSTAPTGRQLPPSLQLHQLDLVLRKGVVQKEHRLLGIAR
jgi:hypothetical protein